MKISKLIEVLRRTQLNHGDIEVTCTGALLPDGYSRSDLESLSEVFETTVENIKLIEEGSLGKRIRLYL